MRLPAVVCVVAGPRCVGPEHVSVLPVRTGWCESAPVARLAVGVFAVHVAFNRVDTRGALLLVPYLVWVSFAAYLNSRFWLLN